MKRISIVAVVAAASLLVASCVEVTTARRSEAVGEAPDGGTTRKSEVVVRTYGWDTLAVALHVVTFPFKVVGGAVKAVF